MGSGTELPDRVSLNSVLSDPPQQQQTSGELGIGMASNTDNTLPGGKMFLDDFLKQYKEGLPQNIKDIYLKQGKGQIGSQLRQGQEQLKEGFASTGVNVPIDAMIAGQNKLQNSANNSLANLADKYAMMNYDAKNSAFNNYGNLIGLASGESNNANSFNLNKYQIDKSNEFSWGDALGGALGAGGTIAGAGISRKK